MKSGRLAAVLAALALTAAAPSEASEIDAQRLVNAAAEPENWLTYGGTYNAWRYSPLDQVNRDNVSDLSAAWVFQTGVVDGGFSCTPLVADGVMYITSSWNRVFAIDAVTGVELWHYYHPMPEDFGLLYGPWNRGVALGNGLVFMGTIDNHLVALDAETGEVVWDVDIEDWQECGCNITGAPLVVKDKVVVGVTGGDSAHRGYINAYDAETGRHAWRFYTIPGEGEEGNETWLGDSWKLGGGSTWLTGSYDPDLDLLYWGIGNPSSDFYGEDRRGLNLYTNCMIALDPDTGERQWHFQEIPYDVWDWDAAYEQILVDLPVEGKMRKLLINPNKGGYTYVLDRTNGEFIGAWPHADNITWITGVGPNGELQGRNEPPPNEPVYLCPSICGGRSWNHAAYSPKTGLLYQTGLEFCQEVTAEKQEVEKGDEWIAAEFELRPPPGGEPYSHFDAYDPVTGEKKWSYRSKYALLASSLATGGNLVFTGDPEGRFLAFDAESGEVLWSFNTGSGHRGSPITYAVDGTQYIAVPSGWGSAVGGLLPQIWPEMEDFPGGGALFVFSLK
ncbi:MAG: PQQ-dependent dehydrogenase, methanol/ethanol family [Gemmatimonadetes bacterium]|nr:PQQ-dependent dehydrogenase, methanol/ethanol family [Gemmatimonadota bacterium]